MKLKRMISRQKRHDLIFHASRLVYAIAQRLPRPLGLWLFGGIGALAFRFPSRERTKTINHLREIYGDRWDEARIAKTARMVFVNLGRNLFDAVYLARAEDRVLEKLVRHDSFDTFQQAYDRGKGVVVITAHVGCFEMLLPFFGRKGFRSFAIGRKLYDPRLDDLIAQARQVGRNTEYLHRSENPRVILRLLAEGKVMGVLIDQDTRADGVFARFLGRLAVTPSGPVKIALRYGIPAFVVTTARQSDGTHRIFIEGPIRPEVGANFDESLVRTVDKVNARISAAIENYPDQWVWMHNRWQHQPDSPGFEDVPSIATMLKDSSQEDAK